LFFPPFVNLLERWIFLFCIFYVCFIFCFLCFGSTFKPEGRLLLRLKVDIWLHLF